MGVGPGVWEVGSDGPGRIVEERELFGGGLRAAEGEARLLAGLADEVRPARPDDPGRYHAAGVGRAAVVEVVDDDIV